MMIELQEISLLVKKEITKKEQDPYLVKNILPGIEGYESINDEEEDIIDALNKEIREVEREEEEYARILEKEQEVFDFSRSAQLIINYVVYTVLLKEMDFDLKEKIFSQSIESIFSGVMEKCSQAEKENFCDYLNESVAQFNHLVKHGVPPLPTDIPEEQLFKNAPEGTHPYEHLKKHYKQWIKGEDFNNNLEQTLLTRAKLKSLDDDLWEKLRNKRKGIQSNHGVNVLTLFPNITTELDKKLLNLSNKDIEEARQIINAARYRASPS